MARSVHPVTEFDRRFLHAMHCRVDEPTPRPMPRAQDAYDTLAAAYERLDAEAAAAHRDCKRLAAQLRFWRVTAVFFILLGLAAEANKWRLF